MSKGLYITGVVHEKAPRRGAAGPVRLAGEAGSERDVVVEVVAEAPAARRAATAAATALVPARTAAGGSTARGAAAAAAAGAPIVAAAGAATAAAAGRAVEHRHDTAHADRDFGRVAVVAR